MQKQIKTYLLLVILIFVIAPSFVLASWYNPFSWGIWNRIFHFQKQAQNPVVCPAIAKLCPDGTSVSPKGPKCEYQECPVIKKQNVTQQFKSCGASTTLAWVCKPVTQGENTATPAPIVCGCGEVFDGQVSCPPPNHLVVSATTENWPDGSRKGTFECSSSMPPSEKK